MLRVACTALCAYERKEEERKEESVCLIHTVLRPSLPYSLFIPSLRLSHLLVPYPNQFGLLSIPFPSRASLSLTRWTIPPWVEDLSPLSSQYIPPPRLFTQMNYRERERGRGGGREGGGRED